MRNIGKKVRAVGAGGQLPTADGLRHFAQRSDGDRPFEMDTFCSLCCTLVHCVYTARMETFHSTATAMLHSKRLCCNLKLTIAHVFWALHPPSKVHFGQGSWSKL